MNSPYLLPSLPFFTTFPAVYQPMATRMIESSAGYCIKAVMYVSLTLMVTLMRQSCLGNISLSCFKKMPHVASPEKKNTFSH